jgi:hypothetical protein
MQDLQLSQPSIENTFGALFIGATLAALLVEPFACHAVIPERWS